MGKEFLAAPTRASTVLAYARNDVREARGGGEIDNRFSKVGIVETPLGISPEEFLAQHEAELRQFKLAVKESQRYVDAGDVEETKKALAEVERRGKELRLEGVEGLVTTFTGIAIEKRDYDQKYKRR